MRRIALYIVSHVASWLAIALAAFALAFLSSQILRVIAAFAEAEVSAAELAAAFGLLLVPVLGWALAPAFAVAVFAAAGRLAESGELTALDASGIGRWRVASGAVALGIALTALSAWLALFAAPAAQGALRSLATDLAARSLSNRFEAGRFIETVPGVTFFAAGRGADGAHLGVFVEDARDPARAIRIAAERADVRADAAHRAVAAKMGRGTAFLSGPDPGSPPVAVSFDSLAVRLPLAAELDDRLDFLPAALAVSTGLLLRAAPPAGISSAAWSFALWRRVAAPVCFAAFALVSIALAFGLAWRRTGIAAAFAALLFLGVHLLGRVGEALLDGGHLNAPAAALLPLAALAAPALALLLREARARRRSR